MEDSDAALVLQSRRGDPRAFGVLARRHLAAAELVARAVLRRTDDARDVAHDAFLAALRELDRCRDPERFRPWLLTIVRNRARNLLRDQRLRRFVPLESSGELPHVEHAGAAAERSELQSRLDAALDQLPALQRAIVLLHLVEGVPHEEIAATFGCSVGMSRQHLFKARQRLRSLLAPHHEGATAPRTGS